MQSTINTQVISESRSLVRDESSSALLKFFTWAEEQNDSRFIWLGIAPMSHASLFTPMTLMAIMLTTGSFTLIMAAFAAFVLALVPNLAALPTKVTIPAFFLSVLMDLVILAITFFMF